MIQWTESDCQQDCIWIKRTMTINTNVIKVQVMDEFEDIHNMTVTEVYEDRDYGEVARVEFNTVTVTSVTPQVATEFIYDPHPQ